MKHFCFVGLSCRGIGSTCLDLSNALTSIYIGRGRGERASASQLFRQHYGMNLLRIIAPSARWVICRSAILSPVNRLSCESKSVPPVERFLSRNNKTLRKVIPNQYRYTSRRLSSVKSSYITFVLFENLEIVGAEGGI